MATHRVVLIPGDGIGPEVTVAVTRIMEAACAPGMGRDLEGQILILPRFGARLPAAWHCSSCLPEHFPSGNPPIFG